LSSVWDEAIDKARSLREESARLLRDAADARQAGTDKAQDRRCLLYTSPSPRD